MGSSSGTPARTPFPDCLVHEAGTGFILGGTFGSAFHFLGGLRNSPAGHRLAGGAQAVGANAPRLAGSATGFFVLFSAVENAALYARGKDDPWNTIVASAGANGLRSMRRGARAACRSALVGAAIWGFFEAVAIGLHHPLPPP
ncbi:hypothetical protein BRADI_1g08745v3 [Brachypodium distachyon]|uniref:Mitochondrial import inner membrane translocase subunit TIM22 n=2 Tax=Brachypodium distachyon TaxID=15368 RepID=A0A0Q3N949_BRADI|nr:hypothetical protein BRADI_1g08745v3 [Brachypodium distachyon]